jgi:PAS domain S-box-containing protein
MKKRTFLEIIEDLAKLSRLNRPTEDATLQNWREYTFELMLNAGTMIGLFAYLAMLIAFLPEGEWTTIIVSSVVYLFGILGIKFAIRPKSYRLRVFLFLAVFYVAGMAMGLMKATIGDGRIWLLFMTTFAAIFLGIKEGIFAAFLSGLSWLVLGVIIFRFQWFDYPYDHLLELIDRETYSLWTTTSVILGAVGLTIVAAITGILRNLNKSLEKSRQLQKKYRLLVENSPDLILELDRDYRILSCNPTMAKSLGCDHHEELLGKSIRLFLPDEVFKERLAVAEKAFEQGKRQQFEDEHNGKYFYSVMIPNLENETVQIVAHDITERKAAEDKLFKYKEHLEDLVEERNIELMQEMSERERVEKMALAAQKLADLGLLTTGVAHELNSPLQGLQSVSDYLSMNIDEARSSQEFLEEQIEIIQESISRCAKIVRSLRYYAHITPEDYTEQELDDLISSTLVLAKHHFERNDNISIVTEIEEDLPLILCNRDQIMQVLINLLTNARDAMPEGGEINIQVGHIPEQRLVELKVIDNGKGIPPEYQDQIYKPFFTTKPVGEGTGLGLFIVSGIVRAHGGEIEVDSTPGEGTTVTLTLAEDPPRDVPLPSAYGRYAEFI